MAPGPANPKRSAGEPQRWWWPAAGGAALLVFLAAAGRLTHTSISPLFRDPIAYLDPSVPWNFAGAMSQFGLLTWWTAVVMATLAVWWTRDETSDRRRRGFLMWVAVGLTWLCFDDMFMFHEVVVRDLFHIGEVPIFGLYVVAAGCFTAAYRDVLADTNLRPLAAAIALFAVSLLCDVFQPFLERRLAPDLRYLFEDGSKFLGQVALATYVGMVAGETLREAGAPD